MVCMYLGASERDTHKKTPAERLEGNRQTNNSYSRFADASYDQNALSANSAIANLAPGHVWMQRNIYGD